MGDTPTPRSIQPTEEVFLRLKAMAYARIGEMTIDDVQIDHKGKGVSYWSIRPAVRERITEDGPVRKRDTAAGE